MLTRFGFRLKISYLCASEEEKARKHWGFSSFFRQKNGIFTSEINFFTLLRNFFLGVSVNFLGQAVANISDVEPQKVKRYLFSQGADLTFQGSTQVDF